ncbi:hypothetical protein EXIGLDRAFT_676967 [Exidia glandulosa HHB12029]|uniref:CENP-V/GFA domain-containing protein n=1 Tax=Exidia glandulosa HHB12029 TaxID=1314781 RepID=A0A165GID1_EXIGL|nr:hypothetical protein EXIGLDRAFT_676967 [Exidia glandulosa HHB12029]
MADDEGSFGWCGPVPSHDGGTSEGDFIHKPPYAWTPNDAFAENVVYRARCYCGTVRFEFAAQPVTAKFCHCKVCQRLHGAPLAVLFHKTTVRMSSPTDTSLVFYSATKHARVHDVPCKVSCGECGSHLFDEGRNMVLAFPSAFELPPGPLPEPLRSQMHICYGSRTADVLDGLPKWSGLNGESKRLDDQGMPL